MNLGFAYEYSDHVRKRMSVDVVVVHRKSWLALDSDHILKLVLLKNSANLYTDIRTHVRFDYISNLNSDWSAYQDLIATLYCKCLNND